MKTHTKKLFLLPALIAGLGLILTGRATAQTFTNLYSFTATSGSSSTNSDGAGPGSLILSDNTLYGTAGGGGTNGTGTVFALNTNGTGFMTLHSFTARSGSLSTNSDGAYPNDGLILSGNTLYGTAGEGGTNGTGTVFKVNTNGTGFTNLHSFTAISVFYPSTNSDGAYPGAGLILSGNTLYGTALDGGTNGTGMVFGVNTDGTGFTNLHNFTAAFGPPPFITNSDGASPNGGLILSGNTLYGTANRGGSSGSGTVFKVNTDGSGFTNLYRFTATSGYLLTNSDGGFPNAGLILSGNTLYGTANGGGSSGGGTVFAVNTDGTDFTNLHTFTVSSDGANPTAGLILSGNTLYGTASIGGIGAGTVFALNTTNGTRFKTLYSFIGSGEVHPYAGLILLGNTLYGTALYGGSSGNGAVFSLSFGTPQLAINRSGTNVVLTWPTNVTGFTLQSTTNLVSTTVWSNVSPAAVVVNTNNAVTNSISGTQQFYRLSQ